MAVKIIEVDSAGSREGSHARYSNAGAVFVIAFWFSMGTLFGYWMRGHL